MSRVTCKSFLKRLMLKSYTTVDLSHREKNNEGFSTWWPRKVKLGKTQECPKKNFFLMMPWTWVQCFHEEEDDEGLIRFAIVVRQFFHKGHTYSYYFARDNELSNYFFFNIFNVIGNLFLALKQWFWYFSTLDRNEWFLREWKLRNSYFISWIWGWRHHYTLKMFLVENFIGTICMYMAAITLQKYEDYAWWEVPMKGSKICHIL